MKIVKKITKCAKRGKMWQVGAVNHSKNWEVLLLRLFYHKPMV